MRRLVLSFFVAGLALLALAGCRSRTETVASRGDAPVALSATSKRTTQTVPFGHRIVITLPPADPALYAWQISFHDARFLKQLTDVQPATSAAQGATIAFLAQRSGTTRVRFVLLPNTRDREATPIDGHDLVLTIE